MHEFLNKLILEPGIWGALGLFAVSVVDEIAPVPASLILVGELLFLRSPVSFIFFSRLLFFIALPIALGTTLGSMVVYGAAYAGGKPSIEGLGKRFKISSQQVEKFERAFKNKWYDSLIFFFFRATPLVPTLPVTMIAGVVRMPVAKYSTLTIVGIMVRVVITLVILKLGGDAILTHAFHL